MGRLARRSRTIYAMSQLLVGASRAGPKSGTIRFAQDHYGGTRAAFRRQGSSVGHPTGPGRTPVAAVRVELIERREPQDRRVEDRREPPLRSDGRRVMQRRYGDRRGLNRRVNLRRAIEIAASGWLDEGQGIRDRREGDRRDGDRRVIERRVGSRREEPRRMGPRRSGSRGS